MFKLIIKQVNSNLNEKYIWPEKIILVILLGYLLLPVNSAQVTQSQLFTFSHFVKVMVSMVIMEQ